MIFSAALRFGRLAEQHKEYLLENLRKGYFSPATYVITEAAAPNWYEIYHSSMLADPQFDTSGMVIEGIGYGYKDAVNCVSEMVKERILRIGDK